MVVGLNRAKEQYILNTVIESSLRFGLKLLKLVKNHLFYY